MHRGNGGGRGNAPVNLEWDHEAGADGGPTHETRAQPGDRESNGQSGMQHGTTPSDNRVAMDGRADGENGEGGEGVEGGKGKEGVTHQQGSTRPTQGQPTQQTAQGHPSDTHHQTGTSGIGGIEIVAAVFALFGALSLYVAIQAFGAAQSVPIGGSTLKSMGVGSLLFGGAYLGTAYGVWNRTKWGWLAAMALTAIGGLGSFITLVEGFAGVGLVGLLVTAGLIHILRSNRAQFGPNPRHHVNTHRQRVETVQTGPPPRQ